MRTITMKTFIPISMVVTIITVTVWLSSLASETKANTAYRLENKVEMNALKSDLIDTQKKMIESLTRIETKLEIKRK